MRVIWLLNIGNYLTDPTSGVYQKYIAISKAIKKRESIKLICFTSKKNIVEDHQIEVISTQKNQEWSTILEWITEHVAENDIIWLRYPFACSGLFAITEKFGHQIFLEHNTNEKEEALFLQKRNWRTNAFNIKKWLSRSWYIFTWNTFIRPSTNEDLWASRCINNVKGGIAVTYELRNSLTHCHPHYRVFVLPNCINANEVPIEVGQKTKDSKMIKLIMLIGSYDHWQGVERIIKSLALSKKNQRNFHLDIYGEIPTAFLSKKLPHHVTLRLFPSLPKENLAEIIKKYDIGIGTLGLYRKKMEEACPLKVREYWKNGLPCLIGYNDTALIQHPELKPFNLQVSNSKQIFTTDDIENFLDRIEKLDNPNKKIAELAQQFISYEHKINDLMVFFDTLETN
jgi:glycosyltransferase involved in cell wall biosynthesis